MANLSERGSVAGDEADSSIISDLRTVSACCAAYPCRRVYAKVAADGAVATRTRLLHSSHWKSKGETLNVIYNNFFTRCQIFLPLLIYGVSGCSWRLTHFMYMDLVPKYTF